MRATYSPSTCGMHHMSLRQGLRPFSARRRRTVSCDRLLCSVSLTIAPASRSSVQRARPSGGLAQAVATSRAFFLDREFAFRPGTRLVAQRPFQIALHEAALDPVHGRAAHADAPCDLLVIGPGVSGQQYLCSLELARRMLAAAEYGPEFRAL